MQSDPQRTYIGNPLFVSSCVDPAFHIIGAKPRRPRGLRCGVAGGRASRSLSSGSPAPVSIRPRLIDGRHRLDVVEEKETRGTAIDLECPFPAGSVCLLELETGAPSR